jgi:hypothetical protein
MMPAAVDQPQFMNCKLCIWQPGQQQAMAFPFPQKASPVI